MNKTLKVALFCIIIVGSAWFIGTFFGSLSKTGSVAEAFNRTFTLESLKKAIIAVEILAGFTVALLAQIVFHEAGHLVLGLWSGYKFISFAAFGLILVKEPQGLRLKRFSVPGTGGQCLMIPPDVDGSKMPVAAYNAGGVVFNLLLSLIAFLLIVWVHPTSIFIMALLVSLIIVGLFLAIVNGIPMHVSGMPNDGFNMLKLGRNPRSREAFGTVLRLNELCLMKEVRPRDVPSDYFKVVDDVDFAEPFQVNLLIMYITHLIDAREYDKAREYIQRILESQTKVHLFKLLAKCELDSINMIEGKPVETDDKLDKSDKMTLEALSVSTSSIKRYQFLKALVAENDLEKAMKIYKDVKDNPEKFLVRSEWVMDTEIMEKVLKDRGVSLE